MSAFRITVQGYANAQAVFDVLAGLGGRVSWKSGERWHALTFGNDVRRFKSAADLRGFLRDCWPTLRASVREVQA